MTDKERLKALLNKANEGFYEEGPEGAIVVEEARSLSIASVLVIGDGHYRGEPVFHFDEQGAIIPFSQLWER